MKPFLYYKIKAKRVLRGKLFKPGMVGVFSVLLTVFVNTYSAGYSPDNEIYSIIEDFLKNLLIVQPLSLGCIIFYMDFARGKATNVGDVFNGYKYILKLIPYVIISLGISYSSYYITDFAFARFIKDTENGSVIGELITSISVVIPLIVNTYLSFTRYIIYDEKISGIKAIIKSIKLTKGHIIYLIGISFSFFLWILLCVTTLGIAFVYVIPYIETTLIMVYEHLKNPVKIVVEENNENNKENEERELEQ